MDLFRWLYELAHTLLTTTTTTCKQAAQQPPPLMDPRCSAVPKDIRPIVMNELSQREQGDPG